MGYKSNFHNKIQLVRELPKIVKCLKCLKLRYLIDFINLESNIFNGIITQKKAIFSKLWK
ncbi:hypothetical protein D1AOALGA4SA_11134 [Olavius algarvensis Delta 1 endosymbiont]|nr:hypothetical protein D1AOALGA4SA_11134 [Olavius algarvensis Delta 1 endosymbiont]